MRVSLVQYDIRWNDVALNNRRLAELIDEAVEVEHTLVVLPEMFNTGFSFPEGDLLVEANSSGQELLAHKARSLNSFVAGSLPNLPDDGAHDQRPVNTLYVYGPEGLIASYDKIHVFGLGGEKEKYRSGENSAVIVDLNGVRTLLAVCYDLRFSYLFWKHAPEVDLAIVVADWPASRRHHWDILLRARAIENQFYMVGVNQVGECGGLSYSGGSALIDPLGNSLIEFESGEVGVKSGIVDADIVREVRGKFPFLDDRHQYDVGVEDLCVAE